MPSDNKVTILNHKQNINKIFYLYPISGGIEREHWSEMG